MKKILVSMVAIASILNIACKKEESDKEHGHVNLSFMHKIGSENLEFDTLKYVNVVGHKYEVQTLKYFISNLTFKRSNGTEVKIDKPIYVDAEDVVTLDYDGHIDLSKGVYESVSFTFGLDESYNISDTLTTVEETNMLWPNTNGGGYHYMKFEGKYDSLSTGTAKKGFNLHTGGTMGMPYHFNVTLENSAFTQSEDDLNLELTMDLNEWFTGIVNYDFTNYGMMIMMNADAQSAIKANGASVFSLSIK